MLILEEAHTCREANRGSTAACTSGILRRPVAAVEPLRTAFEASIYASSAAAGAIGESS